jgi:hypothetical protein
MSSKNFLKGCTMKAVSRFALLAVVAVAGLLFAAPQQAEAGPFRPRVVTHYHAVSAPTYYYRETTVYYPPRVIVPAPVYVVPRAMIYVPAPRAVIVRPFTIIIP